MQGLPQNARCQVRPGTASSLLLVKLHLTVAIGAESGDRQINLLDRSEFNFDSDEDTVFDTQVDYNLAFGTITVLSPAAISEPSSLLLVGIAATVFGTRLIRRRRALNNS